MKKKNNKDGRKRGNMTKEEARYYLSCSALSEEQIDIIEKAFSESRWIPVNEKLPEDHKEVLVTLSTGRVTIALYNSHRLPFNDKPIGWGVDPTNIVFNFNNNDVVAWMPLPETYKAESEENMITSYKVRKYKEQQEMVSEPTSKTGDIKVTVINKSGGVNGMTIKDLYEGYIWKIQQITKDIARLEGERDVLTDVKNDLYNIIQEQERIKTEGEDKG